MNAYATTFGSIIALTALAWGARRMFGWRVCPVCAGSAGTWLWIFAAAQFGVLPIGEYALIVGVLAGGSVVGVSYELARRSAQSGEIQIIWKTLFILAGFGAVLAALEAAWAAAAALTGALLVAGYFLATARGGATPARAAPPARSEAEQKLEREMKGCCG